MLSRSCCALLAGLLWLPAAQPQSGKMTRVAPGVWFRTGFSNTAVIEMKDYLVVIDSGMEETARGTQADCRALSSKPVKYVFLTHHHYDHVEGNPVWTAAGAATLAFAGVNQELAAGKSRYEQASRTLAGDEFVLDDGVRRLEFHHYGWAHTRGDGFAWLPKEKVLFTGDTVVNGPYNSFMSSDPRNWPNVIARLEALAPRHVLPGHGQPGGAELLRGEREFVSSLCAQVSKAIREGKKWEDLVEMQDGKPGVSRLRHPASVDRWARDTFAEPTPEWPFPSPSSGGKVRDVYRRLAPER